MFDWLPGNLFPRRGRRRSGIAPYPETRNEGAGEPAARVTAAAPVTAVASPVARSGEAAGTATATRSTGLTAPPGPAAPGAAAASPAEIGSAAEPSPARAGWVVGTRARYSRDDPGLLAGVQVLAPLDPDLSWRAGHLDNRTLDRIHPADLLQKLCDLSPDISRALWDFLRMTNPGWEAKALRPGSAANGKETVDTRGQQALDAFLATLQRHYGAVDVVISRLWINAFLRGGFFAELVLDGAGRTPVDLATPDSRHLKFERVPDAARGVVWRPFQWAGGQKVYLDRETVRYVPIDPLPGSPYGRPLATPALFTVLFALGLLHDLRRVVAQQGYPRIDLSIDLERLKAMLPTLASSPKDLKRAVDEVVEQVSQHYSQLEPDDAYVHTSVVQVNKPVGAVDTSSLGAIDGLMAALDRYAVRALKTMPLLMGINEATSETHANRQWEIHAAGLKALQHLCEGLLEHLCTLALQAQGVNAVVQWRFAELRASEMLRDAQTEQLRITNAERKYWLGWVSQDAAALEGAGVEKADQPEPRRGQTPTGSGAPNAAGQNPEPGSNRTHPG